jgi:hypothetical protein
MKTMCLALLLSSFVFGRAEAQTGAKYGTRDPAVCRSKTEPTKGAPTPAQAFQYWQCKKEKGVDTRYNIYLYENARLEVGKGRPYQVSDMNLSAIDPSLSVYPVRGTFDVYQCQDPAHMAAPAPRRNCNLHENVDATGVCYKTTFGDWDCEIGYNIDVRKAKRGVPGPR